ncbi:MAG: response regulator transcription factor [Janthinobacterium lividum]
MRILVVEDTEDVGEAVVARFFKAGHSVEWQRDGAAADEILGLQEFDLIILDVMLPSLDGVDLLRRLRARKIATPVLMLTARADINDRISALDWGADDYLVKPFDFRELDVRARVLLRRHAGAATNDLTCGDLTIDFAAKRANVGGAEVDLSRREFMLLEILAGRSGRLVSKDELIERLFGFEDIGSANAIEQYVARLRRKLGHSKVEIRTLRGLGYQLRA